MYPTNLNTLIPSPNWRWLYTDVLSAIRSIPNATADGTTLKTSAYGQLTVSCDAQGLRWDFAAEKGHGYMEYVLLGDDALLVIYDFTPLEPLTLRISHDNYSSYGIVIGSEISRNNLGKNVVAFSATHSSTDNSARFPEHTHTRMVNLMLPIESKGAFRGINLSAIDEDIFKCITQHEQGQSSYFLAKANVTATNFVKELLNTNYQSRLRYDYLQAKSREMVCHIVASCMEMHSDDRAAYRFSQLDRQALELARDILQSDMIDPPTQSSLAIQVDLSVNKLTSGFKYFYGQTLHGFVTGLRMKKARELLLGTELSVEEVARQVGYKQPSGFIKAFKKTYGKTPLKLRKS